MSNKRNYSKYLWFIILIVFSAVIGYYVGKNGATFFSPVPKLVKMWIVILFVPAFFIVIGIHEAGHALTGILLKFDFKMYVVGPFMWEKESGGWKFKWNKNVNTAGGMVICLPTGTENLAQRFSIYALGGPVASFVLAFAAYLIYRSVTFHYVDQVIYLGVAKYFCLMLAIFSFLIMIVTIIPLRMGGFSSDGARALQLLSGGDRSRFEVLLLKIIGSTTSGIRPGLLNVADLDEAQLLAERTNAPMGVYVPGIYHQVEFDGGSMDKAEEHLIKYIDGANEIPEGVRNAVWVDAAFFYAFGRQNLDMAMAYWNRFQQSAMLAQALVLAAEASISLLNMDYARTAEKIAASRLEIPNMMDKGLGIALTDKLNELGKRISATTTSL